MNKLYILTGLPYSGKTTLRKELVKRLDFSYVSIDEYMDEHDMWSEGHPIQEDWNTAYSESYIQIENFLREGKTVIFDAGNLPRREREKARKIAEDLKVESKLIYINTSNEEILRRRAENEKIKVRGQLDDKLIHAALSMFEEPTIDEDPITYNSDINLDEWIKKNVE